MPLTGTKRRILETTIILFANKNYETVSMKNIAEAVGIKKASLYFHYTSKQDILDNIYDFYVEHYDKDRPCLEQLKPIIENDSISDIFNAILYSFNDSYKDQLINIIKIIENRKYVDERAKKIARHLMIDSGVKYIEEVFNYAIEIGRLAPLDTHILGVYLTYVRSCLLQNMLVSPENSDELRQVDKELINRAMQQIVDLKHIQKNEVNPNN